MWDSNFQPSHFYTAGEYAALGVGEQQYELQEGAFMLLPGAPPERMNAVMALAIQLRVQEPQARFVAGAEVDLELADASAPGTVRRPDLIAVSAKAPETGLVRAADVRLVIEVVAPGSARTANVVKRREYADAGIPHYWILDVTSTPVSLLECELDGSDYVDNGPVSGRFTATSPYSLTLDLAALVR